MSWDNVFASPAPYGEMNYNGSKEVKLISYPKSKIAAPENGIVVEPLKPFCEKSIHIKHKTDKGNVTSVFCGVDYPIVANGDKIKKNESIGTYGDDKIFYYIINDEGKKLNIEQYFTSPVASRVSGDDKELDRKKEELRKKIEDDSDKKTNTKNDEGMENLFVNMMLLPFSALNFATQKAKYEYGKKKEEQDKKDKEEKIKKETEKLEKKHQKDKNLQENIIRIKNLLK